MDAGCLSFAKCKLKAKVKYASKECTSMEVGNRANWEMQKYAN